MSKPAGSLAVLCAAAALAFAPGAVSAPAGEGGAVDARAIAVAHVSANASSLGVGAADVGDLAVTSLYRSPHSGVTHVNLNQRHEGLEVFGAHVTVNVAADGRVLFASGSLEAGLAVASDSAALDATEAVDAAAGALDLAEPDGLRILSLSVGAAQDAVVSDGGVSAEPIPARLGWQPTKAGLRLAWQLTIDDVSEAHLWNATVDAGSGRLLDAEDWTIHDAPEDLAATLARPSGDAAAAVASLEAAAPIPANDGARYNVFAFPKGDPNDGPREIVENPADALGSPFGWHDTNGEPGPEFLTTQGNNAHAYSDRDANNQPDPGSDPSGGPDLDFDFVADLNEHPQTYVPAAVTNLFYWCNVIHDITYRYGFTDVAGNFQVNNYGRGGNGGDAVRCEAQDGSGENNANFSTPAADGGQPRMQMFLWPGTQFGLPNAVTVDAGPAAGTYQAHYARFTPAPTTAGFAGEIVLVNDGSGTVTDGCQPYALPAGAIALVDNSSTCNAYTRATNAQNAGAVALVVAHNTTANPPVLSGSMSPPVGIPAVSISQANGNAIKAGLPASGSVHRNRDRLPMRDADFRTETVTHEYGHGVSLRLTGGPNVNCLGGNEQAGEGWSDFLAIAFLMNPAIDDPEGPRGYGQYPLYADSRVGPGFRPRPYSRNMALQPFTYDSIKTNGWLPNDAGTAATSLALPHGLGHGWAAVLWDMAWELVDKHGFNPNVYEAWNTGGNNRAIQYVMDGLKFQGCNPGLVVARDAIIAAADDLSEGEDTCTVWAAFARRGFGFSAVQGTTNRDDNTEAFDTHPDCRRAFLAPAAHAYGTLKDVVAGDVVALRFTGTGLTGLDILASNNPYSRLVDCETLRTVDTSYPFITPRPIPVPTKAPGGSGLSRSSTGIYHYNWQTDAAWAGTCRELVVTRLDGKQHRAFFRFT